MDTRDGVDVTVSGITGVTPIGVSITYGLGSIPIATVDLAPGKPKQIDFKNTPIGGTLLHIDEEKRKNKITIDIKVRSFQGKGTTGTERTLKFVGLLDGLSVSNSVGGSSYQAIIKHPAQGLLELTVATPGENPTGASLYGNTSYALTINPQGADGPVVTAMAKMTEEIPFDKSPIEVYTAMMLWCIRHQLDPKYLGPLKIDKGQTPFAQIFKDPRYIRTLKIAEALFKNIDLSAVLGGVMTKAATNTTALYNYLKETFEQGPRVLLENYMNMLSELGCSMIFSNNRMYVVPVNSVLKPVVSTPAVGQTQKKTNVAYPADYNSYTYNDNGYRDIAHVAVMTSTMVDGVGGVYEQPLSMIGTYSEPAGLSQASGVLTVMAHPWLKIGLSTPPMGDRGSLQAADNPKDTLTDGMMAYQDQEAATKKAQEQTAQAERIAFYKQLKDVITAYAETKFYQARYGDRTGSITMDFNPNWVPGTGGTLYIRETKMTLAFYVTSVTHRVEVSASGQGTAITAISFSSGRLGTAPPGITKDSYLGYDLNKERAVQAAFLADNR